LCRVAANRVEAFDPTWIIYVGAAGSGKTETLAATSRLPGVHIVGTLTEASLLSGTPRRDAATDASGGLLREIGESGTLILKDFGSILSMHRDARAGVLAALREISTAPGRGWSASTAGAAYIGKAGSASSPARPACSTNTTRSWPNSASASSSTASTSPTQPPRPAPASPTTAASGRCGKN
jgi:hypothetical protein